MATTSYADYIRHWGHIDTRIKANPDLAIFETMRAQLEAERLGLVGATTRQSTLKSQSQKASRDIDGHVARGRDLATRLHDAIRAHFGRTAEELTEFGLNPRRPGKPSAPTPVEIKKPSEPGPTPVQTATPATDASTKGVNAV
jgi:hypothetical protein